MSLGRRVCSRPTSGGAVQTRGDSDGFGEHAAGLYEADDFGQAVLGFEVGHGKRFEALGGGAHAGRVGVHHIQVGAHVGGQVGG